MEKKYFHQDFDSCFWDVIVINPTTRTMFSRHQVDNECPMLKPVLLNWLHIKGKKSIKKSLLVKKCLKIFKVVIKDSSLRNDKSK